MPNLVTPEDIKVGDMIREHIPTQNEPDVYLVLGHPSILGAAGGFGRWKLYNVKTGTVFQRLLFDGQHYEIVHREEESESQ